MRAAPGWAGDPVASAKFDRNAIELPRYADIERQARSDLQGAVGDYLSRRIDDTELTRRFKQGLMDAETQAFVAGRRSRGNTSAEITPAEERMLAGRHVRNMGYFRGFLDDMKNGRGQMNYVRRAGLYAQSLWSVYTRGETADWDDPESQNARYFWFMDPAAEHCTSGNPSDLTGCIERAGKSRDNDGFTWEEISEIGWPGESTICRTNCRCHVRTVKRALVLPERFDDAQEAPNADSGFKTLEELLGGQGMPLKIPAAGIPYTALAPETVQRSIERAPAPAQLAKRLPLLPLVLTKPLSVLADDDTRLYIGYGLEVLTGRGEDGLWRILALFLPGEQRRGA